MKFGDAFRGLFAAPIAIPKRSVRCITHDRTFSESMDADFHESLNFGCRWERVEK
jgi:hypothetical protein